MKLNISSLHLSLSMFRTTCKKKYSGSRYLDKGTWKKRIGVRYSCTLSICMNGVTQEE